MDIVTILKMLKSKLRVLIVFPVLSIVCAIFFVSKVERVYRSSAEVSTGFTSDEYVKVNVDKVFNLFEVNTKFINTVESMKSTPVVSLVSYRLMLHDLEDDNPFRKIPDQENLDFILSDSVISNLKIFFQTQLDSFNILTSAEGSYHKIAFSVLKAYKYDPLSLSAEFSINRKELSDFISVEFKSENPLLSAFAVNALCDEFIRFNKELKTDRSSESVDFLQQLLEEKRLAKEHKINELNAYKVSNDIFNYDAESAKRITQIYNQESNKQAEQKNLAALTLSLSNIVARLELQSAEQDEIAKINQRVIDLRRRISNLSMNQDEDSKAKMAQLRDELQLEISRLNNMSSSGSAMKPEELAKEKNRLQLEIDISKSNLVSINQELAKLNSSITGFAAKEAKLTELERDLKNLSDEFQNAQERYNNALTEVYVIGTSLKQVIEGQPADKPESSKGLFTIVLAGIVSLTFTVIAILLISVSNPSIRNPIRLEGFTHMKNIGTLTQTDLDLTKLNQAFHSKNKDHDIETFIQFLRKFRFEVQSSGKSLFLITSTKPLAGKSFIIINLAYSLSLLNKRVLIIDTNFKTSSLTKLLIPNANESALLKKDFSSIYLIAGNGSNYNNERKTTQDEDLTKTKIVQNIIHKTYYKDVDIIGNYGGKDSPSEILAGKDFGRMLSSLLTDYDYILLEGASLNEYSDTHELIQYVDLIIPVFEANTTLNNLDFDSIKYLINIESKILGTVLNNAKLSDISL